MCQVSQRNKSIAILTHPAKPIALQSSHSCLTPLNSIMEEDKSLADTLVSDFDITGFPKHGHNSSAYKKGTIYQCTCR